MSEPRKPPIPLEAPGLPRQNWTEDIQRVWAGRRPLGPAPGEPGHSKDLRRDIASAASQNDRTPEKTTVSESPPPQTADNAVRAFILLFALGFVLRGIDVMDHDMFDAIQKWTIAAVISVIDYFYVPVRTALGPRFASTASKVGTDFRWWTAAILIVLLWSAIGSVIEKQEWPSLERQAPATIIHDMPTAEEIDRAIAPRLETSKKQLDDIRDHFTLLQAAVDDMKRQRDAAQAEADRLRQELGSQAGQQLLSGPINWSEDGQFLIVTGGGPDAQINSVFIHGTSVDLVSIKEAYAVSDLTGHKQDLMANVQYRGYYPVDKVDIPPQAPIWLELIFKPPLSVRDFLDQWGKFRVTIVYNDITYRRVFDEAYIRGRVQQEIPGALGPRITPKDEK